MSEALIDDLVTPDVVSSEVVFAGLVWDIKREEFRLAGSSLTREFTAHPGAVAVLAIDERDRVLLIKQYRHPLRAREWELPAGLLDVAHESPLAAAQREFAEEADFVADTWHLLSEFMLSPGGSNEAVRVYLARRITASREVFSRTDEEAGLELRWVDLDEIVDAVLARTVQNSILIIAILAAQAARARGWQTLAPPETPWLRHPSSR